MFSALVILLIASQICCAVETPNRTNIIVSSVLEEPFLTNATCDGAKGYSGYCGYIPDLLKEISSITTLDFIINVTTVGTDVQHKNETELWNAIIRDFTSGTAQIAAVPLVVTGERQEDADFTQPYMETGMTFMIPKPTTKNSYISLFDVLTVVSGEVWGLIFVAIVVIVVAMTVIDRYYPDPRASFGWKDSTLLLFSSWMWQGYPKAPPSQAARVIALFWWFFCAIFLMSYSASLVQVFTLRVQTLPKLAAESPEDLIMQSEYRYSTTIDPKAKDFFGKSKLQLLQSLWLGMLHYGEPNFPKNVTAGVGLVREGRYALFADSHLLDYHANNDFNCGLLVSDRRLDDKSFAIAVAKNHPDHLKTISGAIVTLKENGFTTNLYSRYFADQCSRHYIQQHSEDRIELQRQPMNLGNFGGMFLILVVGISAGFVVFAFEALLMRKFNWMGHSQPSTMLLNDGL